jgi:multicomponent Na+:H+ antiporter subunit D
LVASTTILVGSFIALSQDNLKRMLAFSTIAQLSYIVLGVALLSPEGGHRRHGSHRHARLR